MFKTHHPLARRIGGHVPTPDEWRSYRANKTRIHRNKLILEYMPLVHRVAGKLHSNMPSVVLLEDLVSYGTFGLMRAIDNYDPDTNVHFETYAAASIRSVIADELRKLDWAPRSLRKKAREIDGVAIDLEHELGRQPTAQEVASKAQTSTRDVELTRLAVAEVMHRSLDDHRTTDASQYDQIADSAPEPATATDRTAILKMLEALVESYPTQDQLVIALYYYEGLTLEEIGQVTGMPESRASQVHVRCMMDLRDRLLKHMAS